ncbi:MAG: hypothetical protein IJG50_08015 [Clostridia bacterium]|nr:hypothetical protein [Clostridia bacterium]
MTCYFNIEVVSAPSFYKRLSFLRKKPEIEVLRLTRERELLYTRILTYKNESARTVGQRIKKAADDAFEMGMDAALSSDERFTKLLCDLGIDTQADMAAYIFSHAEKIIRFALMQTQFAKEDAAVICDDSGRRISHGLVDMISAVCRNICVVSKDEKTAEAFCRDHFERTGIPVISGGGEILKNSALIISFDGISRLSLKDVPRRALSIDLTGERPPRLSCRAAYGFVPASECADAGIKGEDLMKLFAMENIADFEVERLLFS